MRILKRHILLAIISMIIVCPIMIGVTSKCIKAADIPAKETINCTVDGVERSIIWSEDNDLFFKIGESDFKSIYSSSSLLDVKFDKHGTLWILNTYWNNEYTSLLWWNYSLLPNDYWYYSIPKISDDNKDESVKDVVSLITDSDDFIIGYQTLSGEKYAIPTFEDMKLILTTDDYLQYPQPRPLDSQENPPVTPTNNPTQTSTPSAVPTASPTFEPTATPTLVPTALPTLMPTIAPTLEPSSSPTPTTTPMVSKLIKKGSYTCIYIGNKISSKYKLQKSVLTWIGKKSIKVRQVKKVGYTTDGRCVYLTKKGQVGTISVKGKKQIFLKKGAKKLLFEKKYVVGIKTNKKDLRI